MSALAETVRIDLIAMIEDDPVSFDFDGATYQGTSSGVSKKTPLEIGGFEPQPELTIAVNLHNLDGDDVFTSGAPTEGDTITVDNISYRVDRTETDPTGECLQLDLRSAYR